MLKPPAGEMIAATPAGGGAARPGWIPRSKKENRPKQIEILLRPFGGASVAFILILSKFSIEGECLLDFMETGGLAFSG